MRKSVVATFAWAALLALPVLVDAQPVRPVVGKDEQIQVSAGQSLYELGMRYSLAIEHFAFANRIPVQMGVSSSRKLTVPLARVLPNNPPANGIVVNLPERGLFLFRNGSFEKFYPVAIGQPGRFATTTGSYSIVSRVKDPTWMPPEWAGLGNETVAAGPNNPLGDRWIGLSLPGVGFHSTTQPTSIGAAASHGCMRMYPDSVHDLFDKVEVGMSVRIEYEPVKIGRNEAGDLVLVVLPDVYNQTNLQTEISKKLAEAGLSDWVTDAWIKQCAKLTQGTPQQIADGSVSVSVDGTPATNEGSALLGSRGIFCSGEVLRQAGFEVAFESARKLLFVSREGKQAIFTVSSDSDSSYLEGVTSTGLMLSGKAYVPARQLAQTFGYPVAWDSKTRTVQLGSP